MPSLNRIKASVTVGAVYDVTNHYITRKDHSAYGTTRRKVTKTTGSSVYMVYMVFAEHPEAKWPAFKWPPAAQVEQDPDGTIRLFGMAAGQKPTDPFLTLTPVGEADG